MIAVCALEVNDYVIHNRLFKLIGEVAFIGLVATLLTYEAKVEVAVACYTASIFFVLFLARKTLALYAIQVEVLHQANERGSISKQYWPQLSVQGINIFAHSLPMIVLGYTAMPVQIAFYFVAAQLYQIGPMLVHPILTAQYPRLRLERGKYDFLFLKVTASVLTLVIVIYSLIYLLMPQIMGLWTSGKVETDQHLLFFLHLISIIAIVHNCLKYYIVSKDMSLDLFGLYLIASGFALILFSATLTTSNLIMAAFSFTLSFEALAVIFVIKKIYIRNREITKH
jgi:O-antigen/teichoic acid export membrane protein